MITDSFDDKTEAIISPESFYGIVDKICDVCIVTFSNVVINNILKTFGCQKIADMGSVNGSIPFYKLNYRGKDIAFYMSMVTSAGAGTCIEEARHLMGAQKYIVFGSCGCLDEKIAAGKAIIPTDAYRDEGFSYHYAPVANYIKIRNAEIVASAFEDMGIPFVKGKTWTTDGIYRETKANMEKRKQEGCIAVEMECAGVQAVCDFRGLEYYSFLISGDLLDSQEWDRRILGDDEEMKHQLRNFYIALELALRI